MNLNLQGKVAIVTGGSRGLGASICQALAQEGANIAVNYATSADKAEGVVNEIVKGYGIKAIAIQADVSCESDVVRLFSKTRDSLGPVDILINNAGICPVRMIVDTDFEEWKRVMEVNVNSMFLTCREFARRNIQSGKPGRIVNIVSQAAFNGSKNGKTPYSCSKGAEVSFTISFAKEVARYGIYVNAIAPGMMCTDLTRASLETESDIEKYNSAIPIGRLGNPCEIADAIVFLASNVASYSTGSVFDATGGIMSR